MSKNTENVNVDETTEAMRLYAEMRREMESLRAALASKDEQINALQQGTKVAPVEVTSLTVASALLGSDKPVHRAMSGGDNSRPTGLLYVPLSDEHIRGEMNPYARDSRADNAEHRKAFARFWRPVYVAHPHKVETYTGPDRKERSRPARVVIGYEEKAETGTVFRVIRREGDFAKAGRAIDRFPAANLTSEHARARHMLTEEWLRASATGQAIQRSLAEESPESTT